MEMKRQQERNGSTRRRTTMMRRTHPLVIVPVVLLLLILFCTKATNGEESSSVPRDWLISDKSIVLIIGAAGFLGSELAIALHRTYLPKYIICVDSMETMKASSSTSSQQEDLALQEFKRQRAFRVMQTLNERGVFYRADIRPSIPEFYDVGQVPILDYIFRDYGPITHVVHLADPYHRGRGSDEQQISAIPRVSGDVRAGMMESLLEQMAKVQEEENGVVPHFVYASSYEVYNYLNPEENPVNPSPFDEGLPLTTPSSLRGAGKLVEELIAKTYYETMGLYSVGLRIFPVYGPWGLPGTPIFEMAERAVRPPTDGAMTTTSLLGEDEVSEAYHVRDYIYIDDAINAIMTAMQFRTANEMPCVINVGTGKGTSLRQISQEMERHIDSTATEQQDEPLASSTEPQTVAVAKMDRLTNALGFKPEVSLEEGILRTLAWHYDRTFPYGGDTIVGKKESIRQQGILHCDAYDKECLLGAPVFPCASECSHEKKCTSSVLDDVLALTRTLTSECETVLYTSQFDKTLERIPSASISPSSQNTAESSIPNPLCNIAFVTEHSKLVQELKQSTAGFTTTASVIETMMYAMKHQGTVDNILLLRHGIWTLIPVIDTDILVGDEHIVHLLPKLSPGLFFGGEKTKYAIYADPNVVFQSIPNLLREANMQPYQEGIEGATAMLIGHKRQEQRKQQQQQRMDSHRPPTVKESVQNAAYRMIQIGVVLDGKNGDKGGDATTPTTTASVDASWMVHLLGREDSRLFRCDVFGEVVQWDVATTTPTSLEFIMGLHDMWSRVIVRNEYDMEPWWAMGDDVVTTKMKEDGKSSKLTQDQQEEGEEKRRRLSQEEDGRRRRRLQDINGLRRVEITSGATEPRVDAAAGGGLVDENVPEDEEVAPEDLLDGGEQQQQQDDDVMQQDEPANDLPKKEGLVLDNKDDDTLAVGEIVEMDPTKESQEDDNNKEETTTKEEVVTTTTTGEDNAAAEDAAADIGKIFDVEAEKSGTGTTKEQSENNNNLDNKDDGETNEDAFVGEDKGDVDVVLVKTGEEQSPSMDEEEQQEEGEEAQQRAAAATVQQQQHDFSSYDSWMGVLSSKKTHYFVRIVQSEKVGVVYLDDYITGT